MVEGYHDIMISLYAEVASTYVSLRTAQRRMSVAQENLRSQQETLRLAQGRYQAGLTSELDVTRAQQNLADTEAQIPILRLVEIQALNRLAVLLGRYPQEVAADLKTPGPIPVPAEARIPRSLPADLLRQRPDIRQAERYLAAQTARIGVAIADLYPSLSLTGRFSLDAEHLAQAGNLSSKAYAYGPGVTWNIFGRSVIRNNIKAQRARTDQARVAYEKTVLDAVQEVEDSLAAYSQESLRQAALQRSATASEASVTLARSLYQSGLTDFQTVLDAERTLLTQQDKLVISQGQRVQDLIYLYRAFGGGWDPEALRDTQSAGDVAARSSVATDFVSR
jgi:NodT family efflux transporter outer membrane factor (OMF) lipoprotein